MIEDYGQKIAVIMCEDKRYEISNTFVLETASGYMNDDDLVDLRSFRQWLYGRMRYRYSGMYRSLRRVYLHLVEAGKKAPAMDASGEVIEVDEFFRLKEKRDEDLLKKRARRKFIRELDNSRPEEDRKVLEVQKKLEGLNFEVSIKVMPSKIRGED